MQVHGQGNSSRTLTRYEFIGALVRLCQNLNQHSFRAAPDHTFKAFMRQVGHPSVRMAFLLCRVGIMSCVFWCAWMVVERRSVCVVPGGE